MQSFWLIQWAFSENQISEKVVDILRHPSDNSPVFMSSHRSFSFLLPVINVAFQRTFCLRRRSVINEPSVSKTWT